MELRQVRYFLGVARAGTFGRAADDLHIAKSALSKQIKLLEDELGADLFLRGGGRREVELTLAGEAFLEEAVTIIEAVDSGRERVRGIGGDTRGTVRIVIAQGWDAWPAWTEIVTAFHAQHPELAVRVTQADAVDRLLLAVSSGTADLAIFGDSEVPEVKGLKVEVLHSEQLFVFVAPGHPLDGRGEVTLQDLHQERWVLGPIEQALMSRVAPAHGFAPIIEDSAPTPPMVRSLVQAGAGIGICGASEVGFYEPCVALEIVGPGVEVSIAIAYRAAYRTVGTRAARDFLRACFGHGPGVDAVGRAQSP